MIEIIGEKGTNEYDCAKNIRDALIDLWPDIEMTPSVVEHIKIAVNVKLSGYKVSDIDVVVCARLKDGGRILRPTKVLRDQKGTKVLKPVRVFNFVVAVEEKATPPKHVEIIDSKINVYYQSRQKWKSATDQNIKQVHTLAHYFEDNGITLFIQRCVQMSGVDSLRVNGALPSIFNGADFVTAMASAEKVLRTKNGYIFSSGANELLDKALQCSIFRTIRPGTLDRRRMDIIASRNNQLTELEKHIGSKLIVFRGQGGAGKTIFLLNLAWHSYKRKGERSLFLTYNHALATDVKRLMALMKIPSNHMEEGIVVNTVMSFIYGALINLGVVNIEDIENYDDYKKLCNTALEMIESDLISKKDIEENILNADHYEFDNIIIDEGQDWPQEEISLLTRLYGCERIIVADGVDQLIRGKRANWKKGLNKSQYEILTLQQCLRLKKNLALFVRNMAEKNAYSYFLEPSKQSSGGRVLILKRPYINYPELHQDLTIDNQSNGNSNIDFLFCVSPSGVLHNEGRCYSKLGNFLIAQGCFVWEAVDEKERKDIPRSPDTFRVVQYASCRGLEGWVTVLEGLDELWQERYIYASEVVRSQNNDLSDEEVEKKAREIAFQWALIAMTRAVDTLVVTITDVENEFGKLLIEVGMQHLDFVEIHD